MLGQPDKELIRQARGSLADALCDAGLFSFLLSTQVLVERHNASIFVFPAADNMDRTDSDLLYGSISEMFAARGWPMPETVHHGGYDLEDKVYYDRELWKMVTDGRLEDLCDLFIEIRFDSTEQLDAALHAIVASGQQNPISFSAV
ncbi:hypothetical protein GC177_02325 [bacterium]|nr:hypothetical protein [bacterium]